MSDIFSQSHQSNSQTQLVNKTEQKQFLRFNLYDHTKLMLPIKQITEVLKIQFSQIVPIPQMPSWVMGVYNWRGDILWMVDLGHLIGLNPWYQQNTNRSNHTAIVLSPNKEKHNTNAEGNINLGLVISKVEDLEMCNVGEIQIPPRSTINSQLAPFLEGYWLQPQGDMIMVLNGQGIVAAMPNNFVN
ncbi:chemotaxis protein CheW [Waterburya agarophytonicola]|uniref:chemotaxis protein CheW n=1 Tax=Waterburya agarophytonicola TaxID=2886916 RepID=UPI0034E2B5E9